MESKKRQVLSQNFLRDSKVIAPVVAKSSLNSTDLVIEIGGGKGAITTELAKKAGQVRVYEIDGNFAIKLKEKFAELPHVSILERDFLNEKLPSSPYKVFSNIPFNLTAEIVGKLTKYYSAPDDCYLIVQQEFFDRVAPKYGSSIYSLLLKPYFRTELIHHFLPNDFVPRPSVKCVMMRIQKRKNTDISPDNYIEYRDFLTFFFNGKSPSISAPLKKLFSYNQIVRMRSEIGFSIDSKPSNISYEKWLAIYKVFTIASKDRKQLVKESFGKLKNSQKKMEKLKRSRVVVSR